MYEYSCRLKSVCVIVCHIFQANQAHKLYFNVIQFFNHIDNNDFLSFPIVFEIYEYMDIMLE